MLKFYLWKTWTWKQSNSHTILFKKLFQREGEEQWRWTFDDDKIKRQRAESKIGSFRCIFIFFLNFYYYWAFDFEIFHTYTKETLCFKNKNDSKKTVVKAIIIVHTCIVYNIKFKPCSYTYDEFN